MLSTLDLAANIGKEEREVVHDKLRSFVLRHENTMLEMQQTFDNRWDGTVWDASTDSVCLAVGERYDATLADTLGRGKLHNRLFFRITLCFSSLITEMQSLTSEMFDLLIPPLCMYGDDSCKPDGITDEEAQRGLGRVLSAVQDVWSWVQRVRKVVLTVIRQLASLYSEVHTNDNYGPYMQVRFPAVWHALVDLLSSVVCVEEVLMTHDTMRHGLTIYRRMLGQVAKNADRFEFNDIEMEQFGRLLNKVERELLDDGILQRLVTQDFDCREAFVEMNECFFSEFNSMLSQITRTVHENLGTPREGEARRKYAGILGLFYLHSVLFRSRLVQHPALQKDLCAEVYAIQQKVPIVFVYGVYVLRPAAWLARRAPSVLQMVSKDPAKDGMQAIKLECQNAAADFIPKLNRLETLVSIWMAEMESVLPADPRNARQFLQSSALLIQRGILLAGDIKRTMVNLIFLHQSADAAVTLPMVDGIARFSELLMMIRSTYHAKSGIIASAFNLLAQSIVYVMERHLYSLYLRLNDVLHTGSEIVTDQHTAISQAISLLHKPLTSQTIVCLDIVLSIAFNRQQLPKLPLLTLSPKDFEEVIVAFSQLSRVVNYQKHLRQATECDFLYWQREAFYPIFFQRLYSQPRNADYMAYLITAMHDCRSAILSSRHVERPAELLDEYIEYIRTCFKDSLLNPLCTDIENDLRLFTHSVVLGQPFRKLDRNAAITDLSRFTRLAPMRFFNEWLHIATLIENYLDAQFYNLNALMTNDWKTYEEMRNLALERYGLHVCEGFLPGSIVDQGLDVLVITENIQVFVANYRYSMNEQLFVQRPSTTESKHLHTLHTRHIANSIRTHGTGIMNTTVNYVYRCLLKKLAILSQFLYDDHVKSRLIKDIKYFNAHKGELSGEYPIARAEKYSREMRKLGVAEDGQTFLDKFRQLVSEIGNALGYMRMMRSGGLRAIADSAVFIPSMENIVHLEKVINPRAKLDDKGAGGADGDEGEDEEDDLDDEFFDEDEEEDAADRTAPSTLDAIRNVDRVVHNMNKKLSQGTDYFRMLHEAIARKLKDTEKYGHIKYFFMVVPPMCLSHVELMVREKEQLMKKNKEGLFTDDGFALGCVFLLSLFGIYEQFESLHWFDSVHKHFKARLEAVEAGIAQRHVDAQNKKNKKSKSKTQDYDDEDHEINQLQLTATMVDYSLKEYTTLENAFTSCRVFFNYKVADEEEDEEEAEEEN